jgi:hypothetical protein
MKLSEIIADIVGIVMLSAICVSVIFFGYAFGG